MALFGLFHRNNYNNWTIKKKPLGITNWNPNILRNRGGARNLGLGGPRLNYLVVSHNSRKTQNATYMFLCIGLINVILIST